MALAGVDKGNWVVHPGFCSVMLHTTSWGPFPGFSPRTKLLTSSAFFKFTKILPKTAETPSSNTISLLLRAPSDRFKSAQIRTLLIFSGANIWRTPAGKLSRTTLESDPPYIVLTVGVLHGR